MTKRSTTVQPRNDLVLVTGISGSGKSVAMHALEDAGYFCVDNLPPELLREFLRVEDKRAKASKEFRRVAIAVDVRSAGSLPHLLPLLKDLRKEGVPVRSIFLDADTDTLLRRYSETRRPHPLRKGKTELDQGADLHRALIDAIEIERELLASLRAESTVLDTSQLRPVQTREWVRDLVGVSDKALTLVFESFAFKHGVPSDADMVFDVRVLPNPYYVRELRPLNGRDGPVAEFLRAEPEVTRMLEQISGFLKSWLPKFEADQRSYLTIAIGCTGGQNRSVYLVEALAKEFAQGDGGQGSTLIRHRELDALPRT